MCVPVTHGHERALEGDRRSFTGHSPGRGSRKTPPTRTEPERGASRRGRSERESTTLGTLTSWLPHGVVGMGIIGTLAVNLGRWVGSLVYDSEFTWGLASLEWTAWMVGIGVLVWSTAVGSNAQRVWQHDRSWSPRVLGNVLLCGIGILASGLLPCLHKESTSPGISPSPTHNHPLRSGSQEIRKHVSGFGDAVRTS